MSFAPTRQWCLAACVSQRRCSQRLRMHWPKITKVQWAGHLFCFGLAVAFAACFWPQTVPVSSPNELQYAQDQPGVELGCHADDHVNFCVFLVCAMVGGQVSVYLASRAGTWHVLAAAAQNSCLHALSFGFSRKHVKSEPQATNKGSHDFCWLSACSAVLFWSDNWTPKAGYVMFNALQAVLAALFHAPLRRLLGCSYGLVSLAWPDPKPQLEWLDDVFVLQLYATRFHLSYSCRCPGIKTSSRQGAQLD